ncbi:hypothetical protein PENTCL1PPCAC_16347, partial [Pristionchus entomophagus]
SDQSIDSVLKRLINDYDNNGNTVAENYKVSIDNEDYTPINKSFRISDMDSNRISHQIDIVPTCVICSAKINKRPIGRSELIVHAMIHCDEKRFECLICPHKTAISCNVKL